MRRLFLFLKAYQPGLFDEQVTVSGHATKTGKYVQAYQAKRKKRHDEPQAGDLFAEAAAPRAKYPAGVDPATVTRLEKEVTAAKAAADRERAASERLHASDNIPGSLQAGGSNYSLGKKREAMNNRLADQHQKLQAAERRLRDAESKLEGYRSGEYHENGQPRADAPSRTAAKKAAKDYAGFIRATVKPGDRITFLQNPDSAHTAVKMNQKTITISGGTAWPYEDITPWIDGKPTTPKEAMQAFKRWREAESPAPEAPAPKPKESEKKPEPAKGGDGTQAKRQAEKAAAPQRTIKMADLRKFTARGAKSSGATGGVIMGLTAVNTENQIGLGLRQAVERGKDQYILPTYHGYQGTGDTRPIMGHIGETVMLATAGGELWQGVWDFPIGPEDPKWRKGQKPEFKKTKFLVKVSDIPIKEDAAETERPKTVKETLDEEKKNSRREVLQNRIRLGKDVPAKLLEEFAGEDWAQKSPGFKKSATIAEPADELIGEHRRLVRVLRSPSHADDLKEADEQESELREYERKAKRKKKVCKAFLVAPLHQLLKARAHA